MSAKNWKFYYKSNNGIPKKDWIDTIFLWLAIGLFWLSFFAIIGECYPLLVPEKGIGLILIPWLFLLWFIYEIVIPKAKIKRWILKTVALIANGVLFLGFYLRNTEEITTGMLAVIQHYLQDYNFYYKTTYAVAGGNTEHMAMAFAFLTFILWMLLWSAAYAVKKHWILMAFPLVAFFLELAVGKSSHGEGIDYLFVGAIVIFSGSVSGKLVGRAKNAGSAIGKMWRQQTLAKAVIVAFCILALLLSNGVYKEEVNRLVSKKQDLLELQEFILSGEWLEDTRSILDIQFDKENLSNAKRSDRGAKALEIKMSIRPYANVYLKGYYGTTYENATWTTNNGALSKVCGEHGVSEEEMALQLYNSGYDQNTGDNGFADNEFEITYLNSLGNVAYTPYFTDYNSLDEAYTLTGDYVLDKSIGDKTISGTCLNPVSNTWGMYTLSNNYYNGEYFSDYQWYGEVADYYLQVPVSIGNLFDNMGMSGDSYIIGSDNFDIVRSVRTSLHSRMSYSQDLDELPIGTDPIEYALTKSHEGYCMHFASAGTLMLRHYGVPARYVSGYVVSPGEFEETGDGFAAVVKDYNAHAWVEIFIEGLGWVPVEMTPGYEADADLLPTEPESEDTENIEDTEDTENSESPANPTEEGTSEESESEEAPSQSESQDKPSGNKGPVEKGDDLIILSPWDRFLQAVLPILKISGAVAACAVAVLLLYLAGKRCLQRYHAILWKIISKKHTRRAVKRIHRRIYGYLRIRNYVVRSLRDNEMEQLLIQTFRKVSEADWLRYMEIVKKMHYSTEDISEEEMMHCYECYKIVTSDFFRK